MDILVGGIILVILGSAFGYVRKQLKAGNRCVGCSSCQPGEKSDCSCHK
ncbi:MAG: FeoB-associated Cys-rich membrane protein [Eubacteriales bacterium]